MKLPRLPWLALILLPLSPAAQALEPMSAERMWELLRLGDADLSSDGRHAVVAVTRYDIAGNKGLADLWLFDVASGESRQLTSDPANDSAPVFSPDGRQIAFLSKRGDDEESQIYLIAVDGGEARRLTQLPSGAGALRWFPDGQRLAFITPVWPNLPRWEDQAKRRKALADSKMTARVWERAPISYWDHFLDEREPHLFSIAVATGEITAITRETGRHLSRQEATRHSYDISPDGLEIAFASDIDTSGIDSNYDIFVVPACGCKPARDITADNTADDDAPLYSPDGKQLAFLQQRIKGFYADRSRLMIHDRASGANRELSPGWDRSAGGLAWRSDSRALYGTIDDAAHQAVYRFDLASGAAHRVTQRDSYSNLALGARRTAIALRQSFTEPPTLVSLNLQSGEARPLSHFNDAALAATDFGKVDSVTYSGARGEPIQMWVIYPPGFDAAKRYPVYMLLHGGPHNAITDATQFRWNAQVFASWGYIVTWHNFHGSSGFGQAFADSINPDRITLPYEDTIKAAEWLAAQPYVDASRMVAGGGSYGGFLAATLLGRKHPFKALIAHAAVYNSFTQIAADYGAGKDRFFESWERPEEFARYSPHSAAANFATPTLVIHGQQDARVPVNHGIELFNTLQKRGVPSKLVYFPDENHWVLKPQNSLFWYQTVRDWLAKYAPPDE
ncbi:MAG: S9 family peptidase [Steroidobacteraceae bacterium]